MTHLLKEGAELNYISMISGIFIIIFTIVDITWTSLWVDGGAGPITNKSTNIMWRLFCRIDKKFKNFLSLSGPVLLLGTLILWVALLWLGWALVFLSSDSIVSTLNNRPLYWHDYFYYAAYVIFTLGSGEFTPTSGFWQFITGFATGFGMLFLTLGTSYILSIVGAVIKKRSFATSVLGVGKSAEEIVISAWNGEDFYSLDLYFESLSSELSTLTYQHKAYPLLYYYHTSDRSHALSVAVPVIDDVISIIEYGIAGDVKINRLHMKKLRSSIEGYLDALEDIFYEFENRSLSLPDISKISHSGIPVVEEGEYRRKMEEISERRHKLYGLMAADNRIVNKRRR